MFSFLLGKYLGMEFLGHKVTLYLTFWEVTKLSSKVTAPFYIFPNTLWELQSVLILFSTCLLSIIFIIAILVGWNVCGFNWHFPSKQWCWSSFHVLIGHPYFFSGEVSIHILHPLLIGLPAFLLIHCRSPLRVLGTTHNLTYDLQIFSPTANIL